MKGERRLQEGRMVGGCPCGFWSVSNCRYLREVAALCRTKTDDRPDQSMRGYRDGQRFDGQVDLAFLATLGAHLSRCDKCWLEWYGGGKPIEILTRGVRARPVLWAVFRPLVREAGAQRRGMPTQYMVVDSDETRSSR